MTTLEVEFKLQSAKDKRRGIELKLDKLSERENILNDKWMDLDRTVLSLSAVLANRKRKSKKT